MAKELSTQAESLQASISVFKTCQSGEVPSVIKRKTLITAQHEKKRKKGVSIALENQSEEPDEVDRHFESY